MSNDQRYCLATVTTENYFQWTMTMLYSFVKTNPWFKGDIVIICKDLPAMMAGDLNLFERVKLVQPSAPLLGRLVKFGNSMTGFLDKIARFHSLEIFRLTGYDKLLFLDSDMVVVKSVEELFSLPGLFYASAELCWYKGKGRNAATFISEYQSTENQADFLAKPVNTGFMLLDGKILASRHFDGLINLITPGLWQNSSLTYTDELVINHYFKNSISLLDTRYNYRARAARIIREKEQISPDDASIIHFYSKFKPWDFDEVLASSTNNMSWLKAYEIWYDWYFAFLKFYHLQKKITGLRNPNSPEDV